MPASLLNLPIEIVFLIARELGSGDIISLLGTCPCLNILLARALIDNVCCDLDSARARRALYCAAEDRNKSVTQQLLDRGVFGGLLPRRRLLHEAVSVKKEEVAQTLLECGLDPEARNEDGWTALALAAAAGKEKVIRMLLERDDVNVNARAGEGLTPLTAAIRAGKVDIVKIFLDHPRIDVSIPNVNGYTPLHNAIACRDRRNVYYMLRYCPRLRLNSGHLTHGTPLQAAAMRGDVNIVRALLRKRSVNINSQDCYGDTPLHWAAKGVHKGVVSLLLERGADFRVKNFNGDSVAMLARTYNPTIKGIIERYL
ncbi:ankyrin [Tuber magnatum]|uniref:Ankyrin n=1 Tax=Tuber magnatum TaxID=42249 RepID=A0A317SJR7_9PEZI|nr:ankyrin [Tuber magnatum]